MCVNCGDFVDMCGREDCYNPNGGLYGKYQKFHVGDKYCHHLQRYYGHEFATWEDQHKDDDDD